MTSGSENDMKMRKGEGKGDLLPDRLAFEVTYPPLHLVEFKELMKQVYELDLNAQFGEASFGAWRDEDTGEIETEDGQMHVRFKSRLDEATEHAGKVSTIGRQKCVRVVAYPHQDISSYVPNTKLVYQHVCTYEEMYDAEEQRPTPQFSPLFKAFLARVCARFDGYTVKYADEPPVLEVDVDRDRIEEFGGFARDEGREVRLIGQAWYVPAIEDRVDFFKISETDESVSGRER